MTSEKLKPTPGPWEIVEKANPIMISTWSIQVGDHSISFFPYVYQYADSGKTCGGYVADHAMHAKARLIAEAGAVHHECGLSPRELLEGYRELRKALMLCRFDSLNMTLAEMSSFRSALAKHKEV